MNKEQIIAENTISEGQRNLLKKWIDGLGETIHPIRPLQFVSLAEEAKKSGKQLGFFSVACHNWRKPEGGTPDVDWTIEKINPENKRLNNLGKELQNFESALRSFGINPVFHITFSSIEIEALLANPKMGAVIHNRETAMDNASKSFAGIIQEFSKFNINLVPFNHTEKVMRATGASNLPEIQTHLAPHTGTLREFSDSLYRLDLNMVAPAIIGDGEIGPIILNMQSIEYEEEVKGFLTAAETVQNPIIVPFRNAGNWNSAPSSINQFPTKQELLNTTIGIPKRSSRSWVWAELLRSLPDRLLETALENLGLEDSKINSAEDQLLSIRALCMISFDEDPIMAINGETERAIDIPKDTATMQDLVINALGITSSEADSWIKSGRIRINGEIIKKGTNTIPENVTMQIGKNRPIIIKRNI
ncbi:MAG: hypothetical protein AAB929_02965 [Patescibacteria group bacterium]